MARNVAILVNPEDEGALVQAISAACDLEVVRRCADLAEVRASAHSQVAELAVLDAADPDLDARVIEDLHRAGMGVVLVAPLTRIPDLAHLGADGCAATGASDQVVESLLAITRSRPALPTISNDLLTQSYPQPQSFAPAWPINGPEGSLPPPPRGQTIVVWGTSGAPGRSSIAVGLAHSLSRLAQTVLIDADTTNPSIAHMLGLPVDGSSLSALLRQASRGHVSAADIQESAANLSPNLSIVTGLVTPHRWREVGPRALVDIIEAAREFARWVVIDVSAVSLDVVAEDIRHQGSRDDTTAAVLKNADRILCTIRGDVIGINRLTHVLAWWKELGTEKNLEFIVNRLSAAAAGPRPVNAIQSALAPILAGRTVTVIPEDEAFAHALLRAQAVTVASPGCPAAAAIDQLAYALAGERRAASERHRSRRRMTH